MWTDLAEAAGQSRDSLLAQLKQTCFNGWPSEDPPLNPKQAFAAEKDGVEFSAWDFSSQHDVQLRLYFVERAGKKPRSMAPGATRVVAW